MKKVLSVLLTLAMIATFVGCGAKEEPAAPAAAETQEQAPAENAEEAAPVEEEQEAAPAEETYEPVTLHVAYMPNYGSLWSVLTAKEKGYFEEVGITVEMVECAPCPICPTSILPDSIAAMMVGPSANSTISTVMTTYSK